MYLLIAIRPDGTLITRKNSDHAHLLDIGKYWIEEKKVKLRRLFETRCIEIRSHEMRVWLLSRTHVENDMRDSRSDNSKDLQADSKGPTVSLGGMGQWK